MLRSLDAWCEDERDMAVLHCGIAVEHLMKAFLASKHPSLLVDGRDFSSLLHAVGEGTHATADEHHTKSIGALECFRRVAQFKVLPVTERQAEPIFSARNGVAHLGIHDTDRTDETIAMSIQINDAILAALGTDRFKYWDPYAFQVGDEWSGPVNLTSARDRWKRARQRDGSQPIRDDRNVSVASKISQARTVFEAYGTASPFRSLRRIPDKQPLYFADWLRSRPTSYRVTREGSQRDHYAAYCKNWFQTYRNEIDKVGAEVIKFLEKLPGYDREPPVFRPDLFDLPSRYESCDQIINQRWVNCPVCGFTMAVLREQGQSYIGPAEWAEAYEEDYLEVWKIIQPELLDCPVCLLQLNGNDELEIVGLDQAWNENGPLNTKSG